MIKLLKLILTEYRNIIIYKQNYKRQLLSNNSYINII